MGSHTVQLAEQDDGWETWATFFKNPQVRSSKTHWQRLDLCDPVAVYQLVKQICPSVIIHTAYGGPKDHTMTGATVAGSRNLAEAAAGVGARLIHLSSDAVFDGEHPPYREEDPPWPITPYGRAKAAAE